MNDAFTFVKKEIAGVFEITPFYSSDLRGDFIKDYSKQVFLQNGINHELLEVFYTTSKKGVLRGLHFQRVEQQVKLVRCIKGHIYDVVVDLRKHSPTFKMWLGIDLTEENRKSVLVPKGCGHGFLAIVDSLVSYKCDEHFNSKYDDGIIWNDSSLRIDWTLDRIGGEKKMILSDKDNNLQSFEELMRIHGGLK